MSIVLAVVNCFVALSCFLVAFETDMLYVSKVATGVGLLALVNFLYIFSKAIDE
jgi:hypothetical protein